MVFALEAINDDWKKKKEATPGLLLLSYRLADLAPLRNSAERKVAGRFHKLFYSPTLFLSLSLSYFARVTRSLGPMDTFITSDEVSSRDGDDRAVLSDSRDQPCPVVRENDSFETLIHTKLETLWVFDVFDDNLSFFFLFLFIYFIFPSAKS